MADRPDGRVRTAHAVPSALWRRPVKVLRPRDATEVYARPREQFARLARHGLLARLAPGYFALVPPDRVGREPAWMPPLTDAAWGVAAADYGVDSVAVCGPSAARHHGLIPRVFAVAFVAVPKQRPRLRIGRGEVRFAKRDVAGLDRERLRTVVGDGWVTTLEQTALDLAARTDWDVDARDIEDALDAAVGRCDWDLLAELAARQHRPSALKRLRAVKATADAVS